MANEVTEVTVETLSTKLNLDAAQVKFIKTLSVDEIVDLNKIPETSATDLINMEMANLTFNGDVIEASDAAESITTLVAGKIGLRAGFKRKLTYLGLQTLFSKDPKENWKECKVGADTIYKSERFMFKDEKGKDLAIFASPLLNNVLKKLRTHASDSTVKGNPEVVISYNGKITKAQALKKGIKMTTGSHIHDFTVDFVNEVTAMQYEQSKYSAYCQCFLNNPTPSLAVKNTESQEEREAIGWEQLQENNIRFEQAQLGQSEMAAIQ